MVRGVAAVGVYSIAMQAAEALWLIPAAIATAITRPAVHETSGTRGGWSRRGRARALLYTTAAANVVGLAAPFLIPLLFGEDFAGAAAPLALLLPGVVVVRAVTILVVYLSVRLGRPRLSLAVSVLAMVVTTAAAVPLIPRYGSRGPRSRARSATRGRALAWLFFARLARR